MTAGRVITVRTTRVLSTKTVKTGDLFSAILDEPVKVGNWVVVPAGARMDCRIVAADDGGRVKGKANLSIELTGLTAGDGPEGGNCHDPGQRRSGGQQGSSQNKRVGIGAGAGAAIGPSRAVDRAPPWGR